MTDEVYSNFDHVLNEDILVRLLKGEMEYATHPAWDHFGRITFSDGEFTETVKVYCVEVGTVTDRDIGKVVETVNERWGSR